MSHFTSLKTRIADGDMLKKSLEDMNVEFAVAKNEDLLTVRGHRGETTKAEFSIQQNNGYDFGFKFNGNEYELVADQQFWQQSVPVEVFLERLTQRYSINVILNEAELQGFQVQKNQVNEYGETKITLEQFVPAMSYIAVDDLSQQLVPRELVPITMAESANARAFNSVFMSSLQGQSLGGKTATEKSVKRSEEVFGENPMSITGEKRIRATEGYLDEVFATD